MLAAGASQRLSGVLLGSFRWCWRTVSKILQPVGGKGRLPGKMSQTLLTNKLHAVHIIRPTHFRIWRKKYVCFNGKPEEPLENLNPADYYLGLDLSPQVNKSPIQLVTQSL